MGSFRASDASSEPGDPGNGRLLRGGTPREILNRIAHGDPLELGARADVFQEHAGLLLSPDRLQVRAMALVAYEACRRSPPHDIGPWIHTRLEHAAEALLDEDREAEGCGDPVPSSSGHYEAMVAAFGVEPGLSRRMSVVFHDLAFPKRQLLRALLRDGRTLAELATEFRRPVGELRGEVRSALESLERAAGKRLTERFGDLEHG